MNNDDKTIQQLQNWQAETVPNWNKNQIFKSKKNTLLQQIKWFFSSPILATSCSFLALIIVFMPIQFSVTATGWQISSFKQQQTQQLQQLQTLYTQQQQWLIEQNTQLVALQHWLSETQQQQHDQQNDLVQVVVQQLQQQRLQDQNRVAYQLGQFNQTLEQRFTVLTSEIDTINDDFDEFIEE